MTASPFNLHLFSPDLLLPSQLDRSPVLTGPQALHKAIVAEALQCLYGTSVVAGGRRRGRSLKAAQYRQAEEALAWFLSGSRTAEDPVSFLYCCDHLQFNPETIRWHARRLFAQLEIPPASEKAPFVSEIRAYPHITQNNRLHTSGAPSWLVRARVRWSGYRGKTVKYVNLHRYEWTREEATRIAQAYIDSGAWKQFVEQLQEAA